MPPNPARRARRSTRLRLSLLIPIATILSLPTAAAAASAPGHAAKPARAHGTPSRAARQATFGIGAADSKGIDGRTELNYNVSPGATQRDHIALVNLLHRPLTLRVYAVDGYNNSDGTIGFASRSKPGRDARRWITVRTPGGSQLVRLRARQTKVLPIALDIPTNAQPGDHLAGIVASLTSSITNKNQQDVKFEQRVALRTFIRVSGPLHPQLAIEQLRARYHGTANPIGTGSAEISYVVHNTGNVNLGGKQRVAVTGLFGSTGTVEKIADVPVLVPGGRYPVRLTVPKVWPELFMHARVTITPLAVVGAANPAIPDFTAQTSFFAIPWTLLAIVLALLVAGLGFYLWRRKHPSVARHRPTPGREPALAGKA